MSHVLVLSGGSSSGKTTLARSLQDVLDGYRLRLGWTRSSTPPPRRKLFGVGGLDLAEDGSVGVCVGGGADFVKVERQWMSGVAAMAAAGAHILVEDNFVSGPIAQLRWQEALRGLAVGSVGGRLTS
jgi:chloramphenicol 3-O phosphotransferase